MKHFLVRRGQLLASIVSSRSATNKDTNSRVGLIKYRDLYGAVNPRFDHISLRLLDAIPVGSSQNCFIQGGSTPRSNPAPFYIYHFWQKRYPFHIPFLKKWYLFLIPTNSKSSLDYMQHLINWNNNAARSVVSKYFNPRPFKYLSDRFPHPFIYFN